MEQEIFETTPEKKKISSLLNVLTILTFIGCAIGLWGSIDNYINGEKKIEDTEKAIAKMEDQGMESGFFHDGAVKGLNAQVVQNENKLLFLIVGLLSVALCAFGAYEMRKLKKSGYYSWLAGEFVPIIVSAIIIGMGMFSGFFLLIMLFPIVFAILYATQLKHME